MRNEVVSTRLNCFEKEALKILAEEYQLMGTEVIRKLIREKYEEIKK